MGRGRGSGNLLSKINPRARQRTADSIVEKFYSLPRYEMDENSPVDYGDSQQNYLGDLWYSRKVESDEGEKIRASLKARTSDGKKVSEADEELAVFAYGITDTQVYAIERSNVHARAKMDYAGEIKNHFDTEVKALDQEGLNGSYVREALAFYSPHNLAPNDRECADVWLRTDLSAEDSARRAYENKIKEKFVELQETLPGLRGTLFDSNAKIEDRMEAAHVIFKEASGEKIYSQFSLEKDSKSLTLRIFFDDYQRFEQRSAKQPLAPKHTDRILIEEVSGVTGMPKEELAGLVKEFCKKFM